MLEILGIVYISILPFALFVSSHFFKSSSSRLKALDTIFSALLWPAVFVLFFLIGLIEVLKELTYFLWGE